MVWEELLRMTEEEMGRRMFGTGWGWQEVSDEQGAGAVNQTFISAVS